MKTIVVTFDRLPLRMLGCYGNQWIETPHFDRLAARSVVFDNHFAECLGSQFADHAWLDGCFHFPRDPQQLASVSKLPELLRQAGITSTLIVERDSDQPADDHPDFDIIDDVVGSDGLEVDHAVTPFAELIRCGTEWISKNADNQDPQLLWLKSRGVPTPWIPPEFFATLYLDELEAEFDGEEEDSEQTVDDESTANESSPDESDGFRDFDRFCGAADESAPENSDDEWEISRFVYAGYVTMLDVWLGRLFESITNEFSGQPVVLIITAASGQSLGEWRSENDRQTALQEQLVHTPLIVWTSEAEQLGSRRSDFVQTIDLLPTILDASGVDVMSFQCDGMSLWPTLMGSVKIERDHVFLGDAAGNVGTRNRDFYLTRSCTGTSDESEPDDSSALFLKPDDIWDVYDIAEQNSDDVERLATMLDKFVNDARVNLPVNRPRLDISASED